MTLIINYIGTQNIETDRLLLRKFALKDAEPMFNNWAKDPENVKYLGWSAHKNIDETYKVLNEWLDNYIKNNYFKWCITLKEKDEAIGDISIILLLEKEACGEIGYVLSKKYWNNGIMTEALTAVISFLFEKANFHRIQARHEAPNVASGRVMLKSGMQFEGILRESTKTNKGIWCDTPMYSIIKSDPIP